MPPLAKSVTASAPQIWEGPAMVAVGWALTVKVRLAVAVQPFEAWVTVTVYAPAALREMLAVVAPVLHRYVPPPEATKTVVWPAQMLLLPVAAALGAVFRFKILLAVAVQLFVPVTVTVYVPAAEAMAAAVVAPVLHKYVPPPEAVNAVLVPAQMGEVPAMATVGTALYVSVRAAVPVQPKLLVTVTRYVPFAEAVMD